MRIGLLTAISLLITSGTAGAVEPAIVFQTQPVGQVLDQFRAAANIVGGSNAVKAFNKFLSGTFGEKGLIGLDINRSVAGYVLLATKPEDITAVFALPVTSEAEFLDLCERANHQKPEMIGKDSVVYELPSVDFRYKALMRFSEKYAYIAYGFKPEPALSDKALISITKLYHPEEKGIVAARIYFDRIPLAVQLAYPVLLQEVKKAILSQSFLLPWQIRDVAEEPELFKAMEPEITKLITRYAMLAEGADEFAVRIDLDIASGNLSVEAVLNGKLKSELSTIIAARQPTTNKFGGMLETPDTIFGVRTRLPLFEPEIRSAVVAGLDYGHKGLGMGLGIGEAKGFVDELFKALGRTVKSGEFDVAVGIRGPDKENWYTLLVAVALEDPSKVEKELKKFVQSIAPEDFQKRIKWDAEKAGTVNIHTLAVDESPALSSFFGGNECSLALAFAPRGVFVAIGPHVIETMKSALSTKPVESPVLDVFLSPAQFGKFLLRGNQVNHRNARLAAILTEDKKTSLMSLNVTGGQELKATYTINLRLLPRMIIGDEFDNEK